MTGTAHQTHVWPSVTPIRVMAAGEEYQMKGKATNKSTVTAEPSLTPSAGAPELPVALWVPALRFEAALPDLPSYVVGREDADVVLAHETVSRRQWRVQRLPEGLRVSDLGSKNKTWIDEPGNDAAVQVDAAMMVPGRSIKAGQLRVWPLTRAQRDARRQLAHMLGHGPEADRLVMQLLADAAQARSFVILGDPSLEPRAVGDALIASSPRAVAKRRDVTAKGAPTSAEEIRDLAAGMKRGVVTIELEVLARAGERAAAAWQSVLGHPQWDLMVVWYGEQRVPDWERMPRAVRVPSVAARVRAGELGLMVDHLMRISGAGWRLDDLARVEFYATDLTKHGWPENYPELRTLVAYARLRLEGQSHAAAARTLEIERGRLARMVERWQGP